jgi:hypothetical protein
MLRTIYAGCHLALNDECHYADCCYAECLYAECHYAECRYAECRGVVANSQAMKLKAQTNPRWLKVAQKC